MKPNNDMDRHHSELAVILEPLLFTEVQGMKCHFAHKTYGLFDFSATQADVRVLVNIIYERGVEAGQSSVQDSLRKIIGIEE